MKINDMKRCLNDSSFNDKLLDIYVNPDMIPYNVNRYHKALDAFIGLYPEADDVELYSAPGRSEVCGNHTDHQHGRVMATSINLDAIAFVSKTDDSFITIVSDDMPKEVIDISQLAWVEEEKGTTRALIKGVAAGLAELGYNIGGFKAFITSDVLMGAGMSSSAAFETILGSIISGLFNDMAIDSVTIAKIGQYAENVYFGKPCGLMDQMACSVGGMVYIDFNDPANPVVESIDYDLEKYGYHLCITDTKGSHADLTDDYAAVPAEMKAVAQYFGKEVLREVAQDELMSHLADLREKTNDRAVLRALHFMRENDRVIRIKNALSVHDVEGFFSVINESGRSSFQYLQNVYTTKDVFAQNISVAICVSEMILEGTGAVRVHGGGFAGTIQAFVPDDKLELYRNQMDAVFGEGSCHVLDVRKYGGIKVM